MIFFFPWKKQVRREGRGEGEKGERKEGRKEGRKGDKEVGRMFKVCTSTSGICQPSTTIVRGQKTIFRSCHPFLPMVTLHHS